MPGINYFYENKNVNLKYFLDYKFISSLEYSENGWGNNFNYIEYFKLLDV